MPSPSSRVKTPFAPSPSGLLHLGNARTALFNYLFAHRAGGTFLLRVEDTDAERSADEHLQSLLTDLQWLGLHWDEGPGRDGGAGPYRQSQRYELYGQLYERLGRAGYVYPCFCSREKLAASRKRQLAAGKPPRYDGTCARLGEAPARYDSAQLAAWQRRAVDALDAVSMMQWVPEAALAPVPHMHHQAFLEAVRPNVASPDEVADWARALFGPWAPEEGAEAVAREAGAGYFEAALQAYEAHNDDAAAFLAALKQAAGVSGRKLFMPLRIALTGRSHGPDIKSLLTLLPAPLVRERLTACLSMARA